VPDFRTVQVVGCASSSVVRLLPVEPALPSSRQSSLWCRNGETLGADPTVSPTVISECRPFVFSRLVAPVGSSSGCIGEAFFVLLFYNVHHSRPGAPLRGRCLVQEGIFCFPSLALWVVLSFFPILPQKTFDTLDSPRFQTPLTASPPPLDHFVFRLVTNGCVTIFLTLFPNGEENFPSLFVLLQRFFPCKRSDRKRSLLVAGEDPYD